MLIILFNQTSNLLKKDFQLIMMIEYPHIVKEMEEIALLRNKDIKV
jgi:hypothetical protein